MVKEGQCAGWLRFNLEVNGKTQSSNDGRNAVPGGGEHPSSSAGNATKALPAWCGRLAPMSTECLLDLDSMQGPVCTGPAIAGEKQVR